ncbi:unnamed protein product [Caretta caretta]
MESASQFSETDVPIWGSHEPRAGVETHPHPALGAALKTLIAIVFIAGLPILLGMVLNGYINFHAGIRMKKKANAIWFLDLAMTDVIFPCILSFWLGCTWPGTHDLFSRWLCELSNIVTSLHMFSSTFFLTVINTDRCLSLVCPRWTRNHLTSHLASCSGHLPLGYSLRHQELWHALMHYADVVNPGSFSYFYYESRFLVGGKVMPSINNIDVIYQFLVGFLVPLAFIVTGYVVLAAKLRGLSHLAYASKLHLALVLTFFLSWTLCHVFYFLQLFGQASPLKNQWSLARGSVFAYSLVSLKTCLNPLFCFCLGQEFGAQLRCPNQMDVGLELEPVQ